jgi:hypothetical protein
MPTGFIKTIKDDEEIAEEADSEDEIEFKSVLSIHHANKCTPRSTHSIYTQNEIKISSIILTMRSLLQKGSNRLTPGILNLSCLK